MINLEITSEERDTILEGLNILKDSRDSINYPKYKMSIVDLAEKIQDAEDETKYGCLAYRSWQ